MFVAVLLLVVLSLSSFWIGMSLVRRPRAYILDREEAVPRTLAWWDAYLGGWGLMLLAICFAGCALMLLLALLQILPPDPSS